MKHRCQNTSILNGRGIEEKKEFKIEQSRLILRLELCGNLAGPLALFQSLLKNKFQLAKTDNRKSFIIENVCGGPQASIFGPLMFSFL